jgi:hypothetical protein
METVSKDITKNSQENHITFKNYFLMKNYFTIFKGIEMIFNGESFVKILTNKNLENGTHRL